MSPALRIFVVDDEEDAQLILCHTLVAARLGRPAAIFSDGEDFLQHDAYLSCVWKELTKGM